MVTYDVGDVIEYQLLVGGLRWVLVEEKEPDIKNGQPGFCGSVVLETSEYKVADLENEIGCEVGVWGYDDRVLRVVESRQ